MVAGRRPDYPTDVKTMNCLNILCSGNSADRNVDVAYMAEQIEREYFFQFCNYAVELYEETYLTRWSTAG